MPLKCLPLAKCPVNRRVFGQRHHDVICLEARAHRMVCHAAVRQVVLSGCPLFENGKRISLPVIGHISCDSADVVFGMSLAGVGIAIFGDFLAERTIDDGALIPLLVDCQYEDPTPLSALVLAGRQNIPRVRALVDFLKPGCRIPP